MTELEIIEAELNRRNDIKTRELLAIDKELERRNVPKNVVSQGEDPIASVGNLPLSTTTPEQPLESPAGVFGLPQSISNILFGPSQEEAVKLQRQRDITAAQNELSRSSGDILPRAIERTIGATAVIPETIIRTIQDKGKIIKSSIDRGKISLTDVKELVRPDRQLKLVVESVKASQRPGSIFPGLAEEPLSPGDGLTSAGTVLEELGFPEDKKVSIPGLGKVKMSTILGLGLEISIPGVPIARISKTAQTIRKGIKASRLELSEAARVIKEIEGSSTAIKSLRQSVGRQELQSAAETAKKIPKLDKRTKELIRRAEVPKRPFSESPIIIKVDKSIDEVVKRPDIIVQSSVGAAAGIEIDEEGETKFNPATAALGIAGAGILGKRIFKRKDAIKDAIKKGIIAKAKDGKNISLNLNKVSSTKDLVPVVDILSRVAKKTDVKADNSFISNAIGKSPRKMSDKQLSASRALLERQTSVVKKLSAEAANGKNIDTFIDQLSLLENVQKVTVNERAFRSGKQFKRLIGSREEVLNLAHIIDKTDPRDFESINRMIRNISKPTISGKVLEAWKLGLLTNPATQVVNLTTNTLRALERPAKLVLTGRSAAAKADMSAMTNSISTGLTAALKAFESGASNLATNIDFSPRPQIGGKLGDVIRIPGRMLLAGDEFFKTINQSGSLASQALLASKGDTKIFKKLLDNPSNIMLARARREAIDATFMTRLDGVLGKIEKFRDIDPKGSILEKSSSFLANVVLPFFRTPVVITKQGFEWTPIGFIKNMSLRKKYKEQLSKVAFLQDKLTSGRITRAQYDKSIAKIDIDGINIVDIELQLVRPIIGSVVASGIAAAYNQGIITGGGPHNPQKRKLWLEKHQPYSIKLPGTNQWISYRKFEPYAIPFALTSDMMDLRRFSDRDSGVFDISAAIGRNLANPTFLRNMHEFFDAAFSGEGWKIERFVGNLASSSVPTIVRQLAASTDPVLRERRTISQKFQSSNPFIREKLPSVRDIWGREIVSTSLPGEALFNPVKRKKILEDDITNTVLDLSLNKGLLPFGRLGRTITIKSKRQQLSSRQYELYSEYAGWQTWRRMKKVSSLPNFRKISDKKKADIFNKIKNSSRSSVRNVLKASIIRGMSDDQIKKVLTRRFGDINFN